MLPDLHPADRLEVLADVDRPTPAGEPLLSALLAVNAAAGARLYRQLVSRLGRDVTCPPMPTRPGPAGRSMSSSSTSCGATADANEQIVSDVGPAPPAAGGQ